MKPLFRLAIVWTVALAPSAQAGGKKCDDLFDDFERAAFEELAAHRFEAGIEVPVGPEAARDVYERAREGFERDIDFAWLRPEAARLADSGVAPAEVFARLKAARKAAAIMRATFQTFGRGNEVPTKIGRFTKTFGALNDYLEAAGSPAEVRAAARAFRETIDGPALIAEARGFEAARTSRAERFLTEALSDIATAIERKKLSSERFHDLRKALKNFLNIFNLVPRTKATEDAYSYLYKLNEELGAVHDALVREDIAGTLDYNKTKVKVVKAMRDAILNFTRAVEFTR